MIIESWETIEMDRAPWHIDSLVIKGQLIIKNRRNIKLSVSHIIVDGGYFQIGTPQNPFRNKIEVLFNQPRAFPEVKDCSFTVTNNGRVSFYGGSSEKTTWTKLNNSIEYGNNTMNLKDITNWQRDDLVLVNSLNNTFKTELVTLYSAFNRQATIKDIFKEQHYKKILNFNTPVELKPYAGLISHTITIGIHPSLPEHSLNTKINIDESAGDVSFSGVSFFKLGAYSQKAPIVYWSNEKGTIKNSSFYETSVSPLIISGSNNSFNNNVFYGNKGTAIKGMLSGNGNRINNNLIVFNTYTSNSEDVGIHLLNPLQTITGNQIIGPRYSAGILYQPSKDQEKGISKTNRTFQLAKNVIYNLPSLTSSSTGIFLGDFEHSEQWEISNNIVANYAKGIWLNDRNTVIDQFKSYNNTLGITTGFAHLKNAEIIQPEKRLLIESKAIHLTHSTAIDAKLFNIFIDGYDIGIGVEGNLLNTNSFEKIKFGKNVKKPLGIEKIELQNYIRNIDGSLTPDHTQDSGMAILVPENSFLNSDDCILIDEINLIYSCDFNKYGTLTLATGKGLKKPVEHHNENFDQLSIKKGNYDIVVNEAVNQKSFLVSDKKHYEIDFKDRTKFSDISLEWNADNRSWIIVSFPYAYDKVFAFRPFGGLIESVESLEDLQKQENLSFYKDSEKNEIHVKLFNGQRQNAIIFYASILDQSPSAPFFIRQNKRKNTLNFAASIEKGTDVILQVKDINGNILKTFFNGLQKKKVIEATLKIDELNLQNELRFIELKIGNQQYRTPLYCE